VSPFVVADPLAETLTVQEHVIKPHPVERISSLSGLAGHIIIVFEKRGASEEFCFELREGQRAPVAQFSVTSLFDRRQYVAYAVPAVAQQRTEFTDEVKMDIALYTFKLKVRIVYRIADPRLLVTRRMQDPLQTIQKEAFAQLRPSLAAAEWARVRKEFRTVAAEVVPLALGRLQPVALDYGILVQEITLDPEFENYHFPDVKLIEDAAGDALRDKIEHERVLRLGKNEHELTSQGHELTLVGHDTRVAAEGANHLSAVAAAAAAAAIKAIENAATSIHTPAELAQAVGAIREAIDALRDLNNSPKTTRGSLSAAKTPAGALPAAPQNGASAVIAELLYETEQMPWPAVDVKQGLQGATLHLIAELLLPQAADDSIEDYRERLSDARAAAALPYDQSQYFGKYIDTDRLRRLLT
jgi:hypothetical protein